MNDFMGQSGFVWWQGRVEDVDDPLQLGRCRVRILGFHSDKITDIDNENNLNDQNSSQNFEK